MAIGGLLAFDTAGAYSVLLRLAGLEELEVAVETPFVLVGMGAVSLRADESPLVVVAHPFRRVGIEVLDATTGEAGRADVEMHRIIRELEASDGATQEDYAGLLVCGRAVLDRQAELSTDEVVR